MSMKIIPVKERYAWQVTRISVDGPFPDLRPVWNQAKEIIESENFITLAASYSNGTPIGYAIYDISEGKTTLGVKTNVAEHPKEEIESALRAELGRILLGH